MKKFFTLVIALLSMSSMMATPLTEQQATTIAQKFFMTGRGNKAPIKDASKVKLAYEFQSDDATLMYAFNNGKDGYVLVSGDDSITPVLGYSDEGAFEYDALPPNARAWFEMYVEMIKSVREGKSEPFKTYSSASSVEPMIDAEWNQGFPYWNSTPLDGGKPSYTGCPATAMAQIAYYHKWPVKSQGSIDYVTDSKGIHVSAELNTTYDWDNMLPKYDQNSPEVSQNAVAELMRDLGYAMLMDYTNNGSGSTQNLIAYAIVHNFGYDKGVRILYAMSYEEEDWTDLLKEELNAGRPILYCGYTQHQEGHAFVCDGYDTDGLYHINWGWGGSCNGYFLITSLDPESQGMGGAASGAGFNVGQLAIVGIQKPTENTLVAPYSMLYSDAKLEITDTDINIAINGFVNGGYEDFIGALNCDLVAEDGSVVDTFNLIPELEIPVFNETNLKLSIEKEEFSTLADGKYVFDLYTVDSNGVRLAPGTEDDPMAIRKSGDDISIAYSKEIVVENFKVIRTKASATTCEYVFEFDLKNENSIEFDGEIGLHYSAEPYDSNLATSGPVSGDIAPVYVNIQPGETKTFSIPSGALPNYMDYQLSLLTENISVKDNNFTFSSEGYSPVEFRDAKVICDNNGKYSLTAKIVNISGEGETYDDIVTCSVLTEFSATEVYKSSSDKITLAPGESTEVSLAIDTNAIEYGDYRLILNYIDNGEEIIMYPAEENFISFVHMSVPQLSADNFSMVCYDINPTVGFYEFSHEITNESDQYFEGEFYVSYNAYDSKTSEYVSGKTPNKKVTIAPGKTIKVTHSSDLEALQFDLVYEFVINETSNMTIANNIFEVQMPKPHSLEHRNTSVEVVNYPVVNYPVAQFSSYICNFMDSDYVSEPYQGTITLGVYTEDDQLLGSLSTEEITIRYQEYAELDLEFSLEGLPEGRYYIQLKAADGTIIYPAKTPELYFELGDSSVDGINADDPDKMVNVVSIDGRIVKQNVKASEATEGLAPGIYLVGNKKVIVK